ARNKDRSADVAAPVIETVSLLRHAARIVEKLVGVELFVTLEIKTAAVKIARPVFDDHVDRAAAAAAVLRLIVGQQHFDFADGVESRREIRAQLRTGIER